jgi:uncharacterized protein with FMN-binding domain
MPLRTTVLRSSAAVVGLAGIALLAACTSAADASTTSTSDGGATAVKTAAAGTTYKDGTYTESGSYSTPGGEESVKVTLTIASSAVTAVSLTGSEITPNAKHYQEQFAAGIGAIIKGKQLSTLEVSRVAGSSLTSAGFNAAVEAIRTDAKA